MKIKENHILKFHYATVIKIKDKNLKKEELEKIILCDVQNEIYPRFRKNFFKCY